MVLEVQNTLGGIIMKRRIRFTGFLFILFFSMILPSNFANAKGSTEDPVDNPKTALNLTSEQIKNLESLGFTEDEIKNMSQDEFDLNKNLKGEINSKTTKYYKVIETVTSPSDNLMFSSNSNQAYTAKEVELTREEYYNELSRIGANDQKSPLLLSASSSKSTSYKTMTTTVSKLSSEQYRVKCSVNWDKKMPINRKIDVLGVGINNAIWRPAHGEYGKQTWKIFNTSTRQNTTGSATYTSSSTKWKYGKDAYALRMNLKNDPSGHEYVTNIQLYMYYTVTPVSSLPTWLDAYGEYSHQETQVEISPTINFDGTGGFTITNSTKFTYSYVTASLKTK